MYKLFVAMMIGSLLALSGCATHPTVSDSNLSTSPTPYAGTYVGTETFKSGTFPLKIYIKENGKISIVDVDNLWAYGQLQGNKFSVQRYGTASMVFEGSISGNKITGLSLENRFMGDGTFEATLEE